MDTEFVLKAALQGSSISPVEAIVLLQNYPAHIAEIHQAANALNKKINKNVVTYLHSKHISYTNVCRYRCRFCSFHRKKHDRDSFTLKISDIIKKIKEANGVGQVCIYGGLNSELPFPYYCNMLREIKRNFPSLHIQAFSPFEITFIAKRSKQSVEEVLKKFKDHGLDSMGGYDAEVLNDKLRKKICPDKMKTAEWVDFIKTAHRFGIKTTATILFGHLEDEVHIAEHLEAIREIQRETQGFTEFIPIPFSLHTTKFSDMIKLSSKWRDRAGYMIEDDATSRLLAVSRIFFGDTIPTIQASWFRLGLNKAVEGLNIGANDLGETIFDKTATKGLRVKNGTVLTPAKIRNVIQKAGKKPRSRKV